MDALVGSDNVSPVLGPSKLRGVHPSMSGARTNGSSWGTGSCSLKIKIKIRSYQHEKQATYLTYTQGVFRVQTRTLEAFRDASSSQHVIWDILNLSPIIF